MSYASTVQALSGLVGYWRLADISGSTAVATVGDNGTYTNILYSRTGLLVGDSDKAVGFDIDTQPAGLMTVPITNIPVGASARTTLFWYKVADFRRMTVLCYGLNNNQNDAWGIKLRPNAGGDNTIQVWTWANDNNWLLGSDPEDGAAHMVAVTYDGGNPGTIKMYFDGVLQSPNFTPAAQLHTQSNFGLTIGNFFGGGAGEQCWGLTVDEIAVWNRDLSAAEITSLYTAGTAPDPLPIHTWNVV